jgi:hypothetical protein
VSPEGSWCARRLNFSLLQDGSSIRGEDQGRGIGFSDGQSKKPAFLGAAYISSGHAGQERPPEVTIKVLPDHIFRNPELRERFSRMSRAR